MQNKYLTLFLGVALGLTMIIVTLVIIILYSEKQLADAWAALPTTSRPAFQATVSNGTYSVPFVMISDQDKRSKIQKGLYVAPSVRGYLNYNLELSKFHVNYDSVYNYTSNYGFADKGMELSDLKYYKGYLIAPDDKTGILFKMTGTKAIPWVINADGDGESDMSFKAEWITEKDDLLYVGSHGTEQVMRRNETIMDENRMWIKTVNSQGHVEHQNWKNNYMALRDAVNVTFPGYIAHEGCQWSKLHKKWFFLPRRLSHEVFNPFQDGFRSTNVLMIAEEDFSQIEVIEIGAVVPERGYSAFQFVPDTNDTIIFALKTVEAQGMPLETYASVFDIKGNILLPDVVVPFAYKLEGVEFFDFTQQDWL
ncbi:unnamed protein product [Bursaphelenchus xylophilus]|uniref:(pine wood nematode) hypothetical protein n=1 Tax=Bursaphelenchus xylophilus TaxID=6326 RepID=A0A1I7RQK8_BURXY|nr:unnamed protein product [Bursaphelenchus xylophilus]CAG9104751.1 unnamed protein product [Bursaphelenchus xylophilus]